MRAEIRAQRERFQAHIADAFVPRLQEEANLGFAEAIDRLHRVAHEEERPAVARFPAGSELAQQIPLRERGVLELVDEDVANSVVEGEEEIRRAFFGFQSLRGAMSDLREVRLAVHGKHDPQLGERPGQ